MVTPNPYTITDDNPDLPNPNRGVARWEAKMDALRTLQDIESAGREATAAERRVLRGYSGFGGTEFNEAFNLETDSAPWRRRGDEVRDLISEDEYNAITGSRLNDFYTTPEIISTVQDLIGQDAERLIKDRIKKWLESQELIVQRNDEETQFQLPGGYSMRYSPEPDIEFLQSVGDESTTVATIEIKGGKDPAGALERLGAMQKIFEETPPGCVNMLVAGIVTSEMRDRLNRLGIVKTFLLDDLAHDGELWAIFLNEVFHYTSVLLPPRLRCRRKREYAS